MALKHLVDLDLAGNEIQNVVLQNLATAPTGVEGQIFYDTANNAVKVHTGSAFVRIGATADGSTITDTAGTFAVGTIAISNTTGLQTALDGKVDDSQVLTNVPVNAVFTDTVTEPAAILYSGGNPSLATGITAAEVRSLIGTSDFDGAYSSLTGTPTSFAPSDHSHDIDNVTGLVTALDLKAPLASPALTGTPTAPTAAGTTDTTQIATTAFVQSAIGRVIDSAPAALDTLNELAAALGDDADYASTTTTLIGTKLNSSSYTAADVLAKMLTVDGAGSGLDADKLDGQSSAYYRNYTNLTNKPSIPVFVSKEVTGADSGATDLELGYGGYANIQIYDESGNLVMTDIVQNGSGSATAQLSAGVDFRVVAVGA